MPSFFFLGNQLSGKSSCGIQMNFGRPKLTIVECEEKQSNEFDALQAIYWDSKIVDLRTKQAWKVVYNNSDVYLAISLNMEDFF